MLSKNVTNVSDITAKRICLRNSLQSNINSLFGLKLTFNLSLNCELCCFKCFFIIFYIPRLYQLFQRIFLCVVRTSVYQKGIVLVHIIVACLATSYINYRGYFVIVLMYKTTILQKVLFEKNILAL